MLSMHTASPPGVLEALGVGFSLHGADGAVLEANGTARELMALGLGVARPAAEGVGPPSDPGCVDVSGEPVPAGEHPALRSLRTGEPVRGFVMGVHPGTPRARWVRVDSARVDPGGDGGSAVATLMIDVTVETERARESAVAADRATRLMAPVADVICRFDATDRFLDVSASAEQVLGHAPEDLFGRRLAAMVHVDGAAGLRSAITAARVGGDGHVVVRVRRRDGELRWVDIVLRRVDTPPGWQGPTGELHAVLRDVHDRVLAEQERAEVDRRYRLLADNTADLVCVYDADARFVYVSPSARSLLGYRPAELAGRALVDLVHPDEVVAVRESLAAVHTGRPTRARHRMRRVGHGWAWVETTWRPVTGVEGELVEIHASSRDVGAQVRREQALDAAEESLRLTFEAAGHGMARLAPDGRVLRVNPALAALVGRSAAELEGQLLRALTPSGDPDPAALLRGRAAGAEGDELRREQRLLRADGSQVWVDLTLSAVRDATGTVRHLVARFVDTTAERVLGEQLRGMDAHDPLTAVGTASVLRARMADCLADPRTRRLAVARIDLDAFRRLNEARGRSACDTVLVVTAQRLRSAVREADLVARIGSDEFAVLCPGVDRDYVERLGQRIGRALTGSVTGVGHVSASVGIATARPGDGVDDVLARADAVLSVVRRSGGGGWAVD